MKNSLSALALVASFAILLAACGSSGPSIVRDPKAPLPPGARIVKSPTGEDVIEYDITDADRKALESTTPMTGASAALVVNGLGCPQCASNVDVQLVRLKGVDRADVDLSTGVVTITMSGSKKPSPKDLKEAVLDAGFTLVRVQEVN